MAANAAARKLPLAGIKVLELAGLAPVPFAGLVLSDFGADVCRVNRTNETFSLDSLARGKRSICLNLKSTKGVETLKRLASTTDVLLEPFRPGVMEKLELGPKDLLKSNEKLIYVRLNGFGSEDATLTPRAGHDINYLAVAGVLSRLGRKGENPFGSVNLLGDFAGGSMVAVFGVMLALFERSISGKGQVVDTSITEGASYISTFLHRSLDFGLWFGDRGENLLDGGAPFYDTYMTKDGKYMAVGAIEPQFYKEFLQGLGTSSGLENQMDIQQWPTMKKKIADVFSQKSQHEWNSIFQGTDACVTPVLEISEAPDHPHNKSSGSFMRNDVSGRFEPVPAPRLSRTPAIETVRADPKIGEHTLEYLRESGFTDEEIEGLERDGVIQQWKPQASL